MTNYKSNESSLAFPEEDDSRPRTSESFVRRRRDYVAEFERTRHYAGAHEARDVSHVGHEDGVVVVCYLAEPLVVQVTRIARHAWSEKCNLI